LRTTIRIPLESNQALISFLAKQAKRLPPDRRPAFATVMESIKLCPLILNLEDSLDLIGVDDSVAASLRVFFEGEDHYTPKDGSVAQQMLRALHTAGQGGLTKPDVLAAIGVRPPAAPFRPTGRFHGSWSSMKTLLAHGLVARGTGRSPRFVLTERGGRVACDAFGSVRADDFGSGSTSLVVSSAELQLRLSVDVRDAVRRSGVGWREQALPLGSIWFARGTDVLDFVVQFAAAGDDGPCRKLAAGPFDRRTVVVAMREGERHAEMKIRFARDFGVSVVFAQSPAEVASYLAGVARLLERGATPIGSIDAVAAKCTGQRASAAVGDVWRQQIELLPGVGPNLAANIAARFATPHQLMREIEDAPDAAGMLNREIAERWGRRPQHVTVDALLRLFAKPS
jgi:hypothetical protein